MPVSSRPSDKFAFLLTGPSSVRYLQDLKNVFETLTSFYNYPPENIWVVQGNSLFLNPGNFPGANQVAIGTGDPLQNLKDVFHNNPLGFAESIENHILLDPPPPGENCTVVLYFTGAQEPGAPAGNNLVVRPWNGTNEVSITPTDFTKLIQFPFDPDNGVFSNPLLKQCHLNVIMQQDHAGYYFDSVITNADRIDNRSFTSACGASEISAAGLSGGLFTEAWVDGLKFRRLDNLDPWDADYSKFADLLLPLAEPYLISMKQAKLFAGKRSGALNYGYGESLSSESAIFLGKPSFLIRDGDGISAGWWESPDIYLTHLGFPGKKDDLYIPDLESDDVAPWNNTVNVDFRNTGTHPVRAFSLGIQVFSTPLGSANPKLELTGQDTGTILQPVRQTNYNTFTGSSLHTYAWDAPFYEGITHECILAKVVLPNIPIDFTWDVLSEPNHAQRNTDVSSDPPKSAGKPEPADIFRGKTQHMYTIKNPFAESHEFILLTLPELQKSLNYSSLDLFTRRDNKWIKLKPEKLEKGYRKLSFRLRGGESVDIIGEFGIKKKCRRGQRMRLPVEVLIDRINGSKTRMPHAKSLRGKYSAIAGFTIILLYQPANLICRVTDKKGAPVTGADVKIQTVNKFKTGQFKTNKEGEVALKAINPDVYRINATSGLIRPADRIVQVTGGETVRVEITLERVEKGQNKVRSKISSGKLPSKRIRK